LHKNFIKCNCLNSHFSYIKVTDLGKIFFVTDEIVLTSCRSLLQRCDLPLKIDIYACQHQRRWKSCT